MARKFLLVSLAGLIMSTVSCSESPTVWTLSEMDGQPFAAAATLDLSVPGKVSGQGPCNRYFADLKAELPEFVIGPVGSTKMACPDMAEENRYFLALKSMRRSEKTAEGLLVLTGEAGAKMVFRPAKQE